MRFDFNNLGYYIVPQDTKGGIMVDIGTNCGAFSYKYKDWFSKIHFYEPVKDMFDICNIRLKEFSNITGFQEAVYNKDEETVSIYAHTNNDSGSCAIKEGVTDTRKNDWSDKIVQENIPTVSLEKIFERLDNQDINYLKIDCETSEYLFLMDKDLSKIKYLGIEVHCQLGEEKWCKFMNHLLKYFDFMENTYSDYRYFPHNNKEFSFKSKFV
jgi:FkbM family methyltransferase